MKLKYLFWAALIIFPLSAMADSGEAVSSVLHLVFKSTSDMAKNSPLNANGKTLLNALAMIVISWRGIKVVFDSAAINVVIGELIQTILLYGIAAFFMMGPVQSALTDSFDSIATKVSNGGDFGATAGDPSTQIASTMGQMVNAAVILWNGKQTDNSGATDSSASSTQQSTGIVDTVVNGYIENFKWVGNIFVKLANLLLRIFTGIFILVAALIYTAQLVISQIMINIGIILAPIMIPWLMLEATSFLFNGWVKFMIVAGMQKVVGALIFGLTSTFVTQVMDLANTAASKPTEEFYYYATALLIVGIMAMLMLQIDSIASGLVSGMPHVAFNSPVTPGSAATRAGNMATNPAKNAVTSGVKAAMKRMGKDDGGGNKPNPGNKQSIPRGKNPGNQQANPNG